MTSPIPTAKVSYSDSNNTPDPRPTYRTENSNIRPRNRRLISTTEQELTETSSVSSGAVTRRSEPSTRANSPIPSRYPNRTSTREGRSNGRLGNGYGYSARDNNNSAKTTAGFGKGLFEGGWTGSWTALQELAREVLGNGDEDGEFRSRIGSQGNKRSVSAGGILGGRKNKVSESWGPAGGLPRRRDDSIGAGTLAAREADLRTRKMKSALESWEGVNGGLDVQGRHKRRTSMDEPRGEADEECDAMVYVHHVQPSDTLAGVVLKYNCNPAVFRKANRLWPNDTIQVKKVVLLPVDACSIKGRPCDPPSKQSRNQNVDLLTSTPMYEHTPSSANSTNGRLDPSEEDDTMAGSSSPVIQKSEEQPWTHVCWVMLPSSNQPTEIARLPRKTLGYFPPPRRKSVTTGSTVSTPRGSLDSSSRISTSLSSNDRDPSSTANTRARQNSNLPQQPTNGSYFPTITSSPTSIPPPPRREAMSTASNRRESISADAARLSWMRGPGGVGTLSGRKIGSGNDGLNKWANKHLPGLAIDDLPSTSITGAETAKIGFDGADESRGTLFSSSQSFQSGSSTPVLVEGTGNGMVLETAAAAIEGWVRRMAIKNPSPATPKAGAGGRLAPPEDGDLIELLDGTGSDDGRGFEPLKSSSEILRSAGGSGREDLEGAALRGRGSSYVGKGGKSD